MASDGMDLISTITSLIPSVRLLSRQLGFSRVQGAMQI